MLSLATGQYASDQPLSSNPIHPPESEAGYCACDVAGERGGIQARARRVQPPGHRRAVGSSTPRWNFTRPSLCYSAENRRCFAAIRECATRSEGGRALAEFQLEISEIRDLGARVLAIGLARIRGKASRVPAESPFCLLTESKGERGKDTRVTRLRTYLDPKEALEAAGLRE